MTCQIRPWFASFWGSERPSCLAILLFTFAAVAIGVDVPTSAHGAEQESLLVRFAKLVSWTPSEFLRPGRVIAWEENDHFVYVVTEHTQESENSTGAAEGENYTRLIFLRPLTLVVDTCPFERSETSSLRPSLAATVNVTLATGKKSKRAVFVYVHPQTEEGYTSSSIHITGDTFNGEITTNERRYHLTLPRSPNSSATISIKSTEGAEILPSRLLPSGIMPAGPDGMRLIERWDSSYRRPGPPAWDKGSASSHLEAAIADGTVKPGRAIVLGCGTGTNAIYLASKGFDVTALDIAPTALRLAEEKARKANVQVRWLLCDVLSPPVHLEPFDLIFDRGCYHGVRQTNARAYVETVKQLSRPGTQLLILAGNANEERHYGPPRVTEKELRSDFSPSFEFLQLKTIRFDSADADQQGALAWFALLRR